MQPVHMIFAALDKMAFDRADMERLAPRDGHLASDLFLMPGSARRAGRARGIAESFGNEVPLSVKYPAFHRFLAMLGTGTAGGLLGGAVGAGAAHLDGRSAEGTAAAGGLGAGIGSAIGVIGGGVLDGMMRRKAVESVKAEAGADMDSGEVPNGELAPGSLLASLASGVHQQGRADAGEAIQRGKRNFSSNPVMTGLAAASHVPYVSAVTGIPSMVGSLGNYLDSRDRLAMNRASLVRQVP